MVKTSNVHAFARSGAIWLVLLFLFSIPALSPLFSLTPTRSADGLLHLYRLVQLDSLWRSGILFTRWLPDVAYGYGMPVLNYYAPLVYYLTAPLHLLGVPFTLALNLSLAAALLVGAVGMFFFARALVGELQDISTFASSQAPQNLSGLVALVAAIAFLYAPYVLFNAFQRANLAEQWALAFAPFALWRFLELTRRANALNWALAILLFAAVLLSHNVTGFLFAPLLLFFTIACVVAQNAQRSPRAWMWTLSAFGIAVTLAAFFLLPALVERDYAQLARVIVTPDFDYRFNFVAPDELIALLPRADTGRLNPSYPNTLGLVQIGLASAGFIVLAVQLRTRRALPLFALTGAALGFTLLMLAISRPLWESISLLEFVQLPMRLRGLIALCLAPLTGIFLMVVTERWRVIGTSFAIALLVLSAIPMLYPRPANDIPPGPTLNDMFAYEHNTGAFGTTSFGEYLPVWVQNLPDNSPFADAYARDEIPNRFVIPEGVTVCGAKISALSQELCTQANTSWHAVYRAFYFPGWRALVDGQAVEMKPTPRTGLISFEVPRSATVRVEYVGTETENLAGWISLAGGILVFGMLVFGLIKNAPQPTPNLQPSIFNPQTLFALGAVALALIAFKASGLSVAHYEGGVIGTSRLEMEPFLHAIDFGSELQLVGYDVNGYGLLGYGRPAFRNQRGSAFTTTLYWRALTPPRRDLSTFVQLVAQDGTVVAQKDNLHPGNLPTTRWDVDGYVSDQHTIQIPNDLAPGVYDLYIGVYDPRTNERLRAASCCDYYPLAKILVA